MVDLRVDLVFETLDLVFETLDLVFEYDDLRLEFLLEVLRLQVWAAAATGAAAAAAVKKLCPPLQVCLLVKFLRASIHELGIARAPGWTSTRSRRCFLVEKVIACQRLYATDDRPRGS